MPSTTGARVLKIIMGVSFILMGSLFTWLLWRSYQRAEETRHWPQADAVIISSLTMTEHPSPNSPFYFVPEIRYRYTWEGSTYTGTHVLRVEGPSSDKGKVDEIVKRYPEGKSTTCYVHPLYPDFAILEHASRAGLYSIWFPLLFVVGGAGMIWSARKH